MIRIRVDKIFRLKYIFYGLFVLFFGNEAFSQWQWKNPLPEGNQFKEIQFIDSLYGWIWTNGGTIVRTTDGGSTWSSSGAVAQPSQTYIKRMYFLDRLYGWAVGEGVNGLVARTVDGGRSWQQLPSPQSNIIGSYYSNNGIFFIDSLRGYCVNENWEIYQTTDGGYTWERQVWFITARAIYDIWFSNPLKGWAVASKMVLKTTDGGTTWLKDSTINYVTSTSGRIYFSDTLHGWIIAGSDSVYRTIDGGNVWKGYRIDSTIKVNPKSMSFIDSLRGWVYGSDGYLHKTTNGGKSWIAIGEGHNFSGIYFNNDHHGWATERVTSEFYETTDGGVTWKGKSSSFAKSSIYGLQFVDKQTGWFATLSGEIYHTTNEGATWYTQLTGFSGGFGSLQFINSQTGLAFGKNNYVRTTNGGLTWTSHIINGPFGISSSHFASEKVGWITQGGFADSGEVGLVFRTTDGGIFWEEHSPVNADILSDIFSLDSLRCWVLQEGMPTLPTAKILYTADGGKTWETQISDPNNGYHNIFFSDVFHGWVATDFGVLKTTNGGKNWKGVFSDTTSYLKDLFFIDSLRGWGAGTFGQIVSTFDGGETWTYQQSKTGNQLFAINFIDNNTGWVAGYNGTLLYTDNGGTIEVKVNNRHLEIPADFILYQNYPNPFNNSTIISYSISQRSSVTITIFNILGQELRTLINQEMESGKYMTSWDGRDARGRSVGSGIYFYILKVNKGERLGKAILIK